MVRSDGLAAILAGEFAEMPGMRLTLAQVCRLCSVSVTEAEHIVRFLVARGALTLDDRGRVCRPEALER
jgi:DNA-binding GntR family transcriptional regulator